MGDHSNNPTGDDNNDRYSWRCRKSGRRSIEDYFIVMGAEPLTPSFFMHFNGICHAGFGEGMLDRESSSHDDL